MTEMKQSIGVGVLKLPPPEKSQKLPHQCYSAEEVNRLYGWGWSEDDFDRAFPKITLVRIAAQCSL